MQTKDIRQKTYSALFWSFLDKSGEQIIRFVFSILLARLLLPEHFGLVGMAYVVMEIARVFVQSGFGLALINATDVTRKDESSVFYFNIIIGGVATGIIFLLSPLIAGFYNAPELKSIIQALSLTVLIGSAGTIQSVLLTKRINFRSQTRVNLPSTLVSGLAGILLAYKGYGVWSLVFQALLRTTITTSLLWIVYSWRPGFVFSISSLRRLFRFGSRMLMGSLVQVLFNNLYVILIGKLFLPTQLGFFTKAKQIQQLPVSTFWEIVGRVSFPVLSSLKHQQAKFTRALSKASANIAFVIFPLLVIGTLVAPSLFRALLGERWMPAVPMFQLLCIGNLFLPLEYIRSNALLAKGKATLSFKLLCVRNLMVLVSALVSFRYGIEGMLLANGITGYLFFVLYSLLIGRQTGYSLPAQISDIFPYLFCTAAAGGVVYLTGVLFSGPLLLSLALQVAAGASAYLICGFALKLGALKDNKEMVLSLLARAG